MPSDEASGWRDLEAVHFNTLGVLIREGHSQNTPPSKLRKQSLTQKCSTLLSCHVCPQTPVVHSLLPFISSPESSGCLAYEWLWNERGPFPKEVTHSGCGVPCLVTSDLVRTESPRCSHSVNLLPYLCRYGFIFPRLGKGREENKYIDVDRYVHMSFLNSQSSPWVKTSCR